MPFSQLVYSRIKAGRFLHITHEDSGLEKEYVETVNSLLQEDKYRRKITSFIIRDSPDEIKWQILTSLVVNRDMDWFIASILLNELTLEQKAVFAYLLSWIFNRNSVSEIEKVFTIYELDPQIKYIFAPYFEERNLNSDIAIRERKNYFKVKKLEEESKEEQRVSLPPLNDRMTILLDRFEHGEINIWIYIVDSLRYESNGTLPPLIAVNNITELPGWNRIDKYSQERIIRASKDYVVFGDPHYESWLGQNKILYSALCGYYAFVTLLTNDKSKFLEITSEAWEKWLIALLKYPHIQSEQSIDFQKTLIEIAYIITGSKFISELIKLIDIEEKSDNIIHILERLDGIWDDSLLQALHLKLMDTSLSPDTTRAILNSLIKNKYAKSSEYAISILQNEYPSERSIAIASSLLTYDPRSAWKIIWHLFSTDNGFGIQVMENSINALKYDNSPLLKVLHEEELAELFIWLEKQYPYETHFVASKEEVSRWKDSVLGELVARGTYEACLQVERIMYNFPELDWIKWHLFQARENARQEEWQPFNIPEIIELLENKRKRVIRNGQDLVELLMESLERLQTKLSGETPMAIHLWNEWNGEYRPKDENDLSNFVKSHLEQDLKESGIVVNREVEIRQGNGSKGERTDIYVNAIPRLNTEAEIISVIIETKGCWHPDLMISMRTQLLDRYLRDNNKCQHGIYLVGWYLCPQWIDEGRKKNTEKYAESINELTAALQKQAESLSKETSKFISTFVLDSRLR